MKKFYISLLICLSTALIVKANDIPNAGLGIVLQKVNNQTLVEKIMPNSNMGKNGLWGGDIITDIDGISIENLSLEEIKAKLKGAKGSRVTVKILKEEEYENFWGKKKTQFVPYQITLIRNYEIDSNLPVQVFKNGDRYSIKMQQQGKNLKCDVIYTRKGNLYNRELACRNGYTYTSGSGTNIKMPNEFWINFDQLIFNKYNEYSLWHSNPDSIIKNSKELQLAKLLNPPPPKDGTPCGSPTTGGVGIWKNGACVVDMTKDMTKQEKEDYFRAADFEEEFENYIRYKRMYP